MYNNTLGIFMGRADRIFAAQVTYGMGSSPLVLIILDINMDSIQDIFVAGFQSSFHLGLQDDTFSPAEIYDKPGEGTLVVDFNRNYVPDVVMISGDGLEFIERNYCKP